MALDPAVWAGKPPPDHLRVRVRVFDAENREIVASRDLAEVRAALLAQSRQASLEVAREDPAAWRKARARWETPEGTTWAFDPMPERVWVTEQAGAPIYAFPGLLAGQGGVARRLFKTPEEAQAATARGLAALFESQLGHDLMWTQRDLRALRELAPLAATLAPIETLQEDAFAAIRRWVIGRPVAPLNGATFATVLEKAKADLRGIVPRLVDLLREILTLRLELQVAAGAPASQAADLVALVPPDFLRVTPYAQLAHFPRYLKAMKLRTERARKNPARDAERQAQLAPYLAALRAREARASPARREPSAAAPGEGTGAAVDRSALEAARWLIEEFRVSLFAQELGTAEPVSAVKLDRVFAALRAGPTVAAGGAAPASLAPAAKPIVAAAVGAKKTTPLKNLNALDRLFRR